MAARFAVPFLILAVLFLPLPFVVAVFVFGVLLVARPRGEPCREAVVGRCHGRPALFRGPPR
jgi:hypothetical protein